MKIPLIIAEYLESNQKSEPFEVVLIDNIACDDCYKVTCEFATPAPKKCLIIIEDFEIALKEDSIILKILKFFVKSTKVEDYSKYLCLVDNCPQVVNSVKKFKYSQVVKKVIYEDSYSSFPNKMISSSADYIGFGLNSKDKCEEFSKARRFQKVIASQDDILTAVCPREIMEKPIEKPMERNDLGEKSGGKGKVSIETEEFPVFPEWALNYLSYIIKGVK